MELLEDFFNFISLNQTNGEKFPKIMVRSRIPDYEYEEKKGSFRSELQEFVWSVKGTGAILDGRDTLATATQEDLSFLDDFVDVGIDCAILYAKQEIVKKVKPWIDLINDFVYPFLDVLNKVEKQQKTDCKFINITIFLKKENKFFSVQDYKKLMTQRIFTKPFYNHKTFFVGQTLPTNEEKRVFGPLLDNFLRVN